MIPTFNGRLIVTSARYDPVLDVSYRLGDGLGKKRRSTKASQFATSALRVRMAKPADAAWLRNQWPEWVGGEMDVVMEALRAGGRDLTLSNILVLSLEAVRTGKVCGGLIAAPPHRLIRLYLSDRSEAVRERVVKLEALGVDPNHRGQGGGSLMVQEAIKRFREASYRWMYGQFETDRRLTHFYSQLGFNVHPPGIGIDFPERLGLGPFTIRSVPNDQLFEQVL
jgi:GNAT superfamily N-acetyltransferase